MVRIKTSTIKFTEMVLNKIILQNGNGSNIYGLTGAAWFQSNQVIQNYIIQNKINYIHASNESSAIYQCSYEAYSYNLKNNDTKVGVSFVTAGPGTTMALTGLASALKEAVPVVCFFGVPVVNFQFIDIDIARSTCKYVFYITPNTVNPQHIIDMAFQMALNGTKNNRGMGSVGVFVLDSLWDQPFKYTNLSRYIINYPIQYYKIDIMINKILKSLTKNSKIIIRIGERINLENVQQLVLLSTLYTNIYVHLTMHTSDYVNSFDTENMENVGIEGPTENPYINQHYETATHVIDIGQGIEYNALVYSDVKPLMNSNAKIYYIYDTPLQYKPSSMNIWNTIYVNPNDFIPLFINKYKKIIKQPNVQWVNDDTKLDYYNNILTAYQNQTNNDICTVISLIANIFYQFYSFSNNRTNNIPLLDDTLLYSVDVGMASFYSQSFIHTKNTFSKLFLSEFSAIGSSLSCTSGYLRTGNYTGFVNIIGDGGFMNVPGYAIELKNVCMDNPSLSGLILLGNDSTYSYVQYAEFEMFDETTSITQTDYLQQGINIGLVLKYLLGDVVNDYVEYNSLTLNDLSPMQSYVNNWYNTKPTGITIIHLIGKKSLPITL